MFTIVVLTDLIAAAVLVHPLDLCNLSIVERIVNLFALPGSERLSSIFLLTFVE